MPFTAADRPVVVLATRMFVPDVGAAAYRLAALASRLVDDGAAVEVLTTCAAAGRAAPEPEPAGVRVRRWPVRRDATGTVRGYLSYASFDLPLLGRLLLRPRPEVIVAEPPPTTGAVVAVVAAVRRVPYVYYAADIWSAAAAGMGAPRAVVTLLRAVETAVLRRAALVLTVSESVAAELAAMGVPAQRLQVVGTGIDVDLFTPDGPRDRPGHPLAVYAGTMSEFQGAEVFVRALAGTRRRHPGARLVMLGQGSEQAQLRALAEELVPGAVDFPGVVGAAEAARWLRSADVGLASIRPHRRYDFAFPTKIFAATACGTPVLYAGPGPCAELVRDAGLGWAVPWQVEAVAQALAEAFDRPQPQDRRRLAAWTREHHSLTAVAGRASAAVLSAAGPLSRRPASPDDPGAAARRCPAPPLGPPGS